MTSLQLSLPSGKAEFSVDEAANVLGISSSELRTLVVERFGDDDSARNGLTRMRFRPADLIMLNMVQAARRKPD